MNYLEMLKEKVNNSSKSTVANELGISIGHLNNILSGKRVITDSIIDKLEDVEIYRIPREYSDIIKLFDFIYDNADRVDIIEKLEVTISKYTK